MTFLATIPDTSVVVYHNDTGFGLQRRIPHSGTELAGGTTSFARSGWSRVAPDRTAGDRRPAQSDNLRPKEQGEEEAAFCAGAASGLSEIGLREVDAHREAIEASRDIFDAVLSAYTGWLGPERLEAPPENFNVASGRIWFPAAA